MSYFFRIMRFFLHASLCQKKSGHYQQWMEISRGDSVWFTPSKIAPGVISRFRSTEKYAVEAREIGYSCQKLREITTKFVMRQTPRARKVSWVAPRKWSLDTNFSFLEASGGQLRHHLYIFFHHLLSSSFSETWKRTLSNFQILPTREQLVGFNGFTTATFPILGRKLQRPRKISDWQIAETPK